MQTSENSFVQTEQLAQEQRRFFSVIYLLLTTLQEQRSSFFSPANRAFYTQSQMVFGELRKSPSKPLSLSKRQRNPHNASDPAIPLNQHPGIWFTSRQTVAVGQDKISMAIRTNIAGSFSPESFVPACSKGTVTIEINNAQTSIQILTVGLFFHPGELVGLERGECFHQDRFYASRDVFSLRNNSPGFGEIEKELQAAMQSLFSQVPAQAPADQKQPR